MKALVRKFSVVLLLAAGELLLGILLLVNPKGLTTAVIIGVGVVLIAVGIFKLFRYIRLPREEASHTWDLAEGAGLIALGIIAITHQPWLVQILDTLTALYGTLILILAFMKLQITVDAIRGTKLRWQIMACSFLAIAALAILLVTNVLTENIVWIVTGIVLIIAAFADTIYFILSRKTVPVTISTETAIIAENPDSDVE